MWNTGCDSWYFTEEGNVDLCPLLPEGDDTVLAQVDDHNFNVTRGYPSQPERVVGLDFHDAVAARIANELLDAPTCLSFETARY